MEDARTALDRLNLLLENSAALNSEHFLKLIRATERLSIELYRERENRKEALKVAADRGGPVIAASKVVQDAAVFAIYLDGNYEARL